MRILRMSREISFAFISEEERREEKRSSRQTFCTKVLARLIYQVTYASWSNKDHFFLPRYYITSSECYLGSLLSFYWSSSWLPYIWLPRTYDFASAGVGSVGRSRKLAMVKYSVHLRQTWRSLLKELLSQGCVTVVVSSFCGQPSMARLDRESVSTATYTKTSDCYNPFN